VTRGRTQRFLVTEVTPDGARRRPDDLIVEEPMTIQLDGTVVSTTMRTPGNDFELAAGYCHTEGLLDGAPVNAVKYCADGSAVESAFNIVTVDTGGRAPTPTPRLGTTSSSCGWCGSDQLDEMYARLAPLEPSGPMPLELLGRIPDLVAEHQGLFDATGAVHAAATFDIDGNIGLVREDVGRHNAVDKIVGALLLAGDLPSAGDPANDQGLFVSGRASVEMVQKAWAAGFSTVVAVSAPTALAVEAARHGNVMLAGFVRPGRFNVYSPERLAPRPG
jgi:FdhD protein